ncbi:MAG: cobalamin-dependent protein, partial [Polyangiaceae bacterium]|nr:cobalamin-dependent protein [Polyangiaceae bacterium]
MRLLLIHAPMLHVAQLERPPTSTHLHVIYSYLRARGVSVDVYDPIVELGLPGADAAEYLQRLQLALQGRRFDIAGVSAWTSFQYLGSLAVGRLLRELRPDAPLAVGGYHPSLVPSDYLPPQSDGPFDYIVRGAGEGFLLRLCENPRRPNQPEVVQGQPAPLDDVRLDWSYPYHQAGVFLSRGCPFACTYCSHRTAAHESMSHIVKMIEDGWDVVIAHGNGPQVGFILRRSELSMHELHAVPLDYCGADTQGAIGYMFIQNLHNDFLKKGIKKQAVCIVTQTVVDRNDKAFANPTKPIGSFMDEKTAKEHMAADKWTVVEDSGRGWRRVVASPIPQRIVEADAIQNLIDHGFVVVAVGGGGIPVIEKENGDLEGVEA